MKAHAVELIDIEKLHNDGKRFIIIDLDNTIARWSTFMVKDAVKHWLEQAKQKGFDICILSNNHNKKRTSDIARHLGIKNADSASKKPSKGAFADALRVMNGIREKTVVIGDQLFGDMRGAKNAGMDAILVDPIHKKEAPITRALRIWERLSGRSIKWQDR